MAYFEENSEAMLALEGMVDAVNLRNVVTALVHICHAKAEHVRTNWQDHVLARDWERNARVLDKACSRLDNIP